MLYVQYLYFCLVLSCKWCSCSRSQVLNPTQPHTARSLLSLSASSRWQLGVGSGEMQNLLLLLCRSVTRLKPAFIVKGIPWKAYFTCAVHRFCNRSKDVKSIPTFHLRDFDTESLVVLSRSTINGRSTVAYALRFLRFLRTFPAFPVLSLFR